MFPQENKTVKRGPIPRIPIMIIAAGIIATIFMILLDRKSPMKLKR